MEIQIKVQKALIDVVNQVFEIERKVHLLKETNSLERNIDKLKQIIENDLLKSLDSEPTGLVYHDPIGETYNETRTDCEASIAGTSTENLYISEVIKPIIRYKKAGINIIVQKAIVVTQSRNK